MGIIGLFVVKLFPMRCFLLLVAMAITSQGFSQITFTKADLPKVNDTLYRNTSSVLKSSFNPGASPQNTTWDLSWLTGSSQAMVHFSDPALHPEASSLGNANIIQHDEFDFFCEKTDSGYFAMGLLTDPTTLPADEPVESFDSAINFLPIPLNLNDKVTTGGEVRLTLTDPFITLKLWIELTREIDVVNYGKLKMDNDSTYDVLVVDMFETRKDTTTTIFNNDTNVSNSVVEAYYYEFYSKRFGLPLVRAERDPVTDTIIRIEYLELDRTMVSTADRLPQSLRVFPNPSEGTTWVELPSGGQRIEVLNMMGQTVKVDNIGKDANLYQVDGLSEGVYIVSVYGSSDTPVGMARFTVR